MPTPTGTSAPGVAKPSAAPGTALRPRLGARGKGGPLTLPDPPPRRNLPDVTARDFERVDLSQYKWIHWEVSLGLGGQGEPGAEMGTRGQGDHKAGRLHGQAVPVPGSVCPQARNAAEQVAMIRRVEQYNQSRPAAERVRISVEVEKPRQELLQLMGLGHVVRGGSSHRGRDRRGTGAGGRDQTLIWEEAGAEDMVGSHRAVLGLGVALPPLGGVRTTGGVARGGATCRECGPGATGKEQRSRSIEASGGIQRCGGQVGVRGVG